MIAKKIITGSIMFAFLLAAAPSSAQAGEVIILDPGKCRHGLFFQPNGPFAVMLFCEDALGSHLGVIYYKIMGVPLKGEWSLTDRFWQQEDWGAGVTAFAWDSAGKYLFVSTSAISGTGYYVYRLDLINREVKRLFPHAKYEKETEEIKKICHVKMLKLDEIKQKVNISVEDCDLTTEVKIRIKY